MKLPKVNIDKLGNVALIIGCVYYITNCGKDPVIIHQEDPAKSEYLIKIHDLEKQVLNYESELLKLKVDYEKDTIDINNDTRIEHINSITDRYR